MKLGLVISDCDPETVWNALRVANFALGQGDEVKVFLVGKGVELERIDDERFNVREQTEKCVEAGGKILACGTCLRARNMSGSKVCPLSTMKDLHDLLREADRVLSF